MAKTPTSVRIDSELQAELEELARRRLVPPSFSEQVHAGLRLLVSQAREAQTRHAAGLVGTDGQRAQQAYRRLHPRAR